jgi:glyoxylate/hydroxypyruvate reductase A
LRQRNKAPFKLPQSPESIAMPAPRIAFVTRIEPDEEEAWLGKLRAAMPDETIVPIRQIPEDERASVDIAIVANPDPADLARLPNLKWIHSLWAGVERLVGELGDLKVPIVRLVDPELARTMAEATLAWTYYLFRDMPAYAAQQRDAVWKPLAYTRPEKTTVGVLGLGALGSAALIRLRDAGFSVVGWSRTPKTIEGIEIFAGEETLERMLARTDILVCLLPLTAETRGLLDATRLAQLPRGASLINFGRGPIVVDGDLVASLDAGHMKHAVLDVFGVEPLPGENPLWRHPKITVLPHISAPTDMETATGIVAGNLRAYRADGTIPPSVDVGRGY